MPIYQHVTDAGMDICASEDVTLAPGETALVHKSNDVETHVSLDRGMNGVRLFLLASLQLTLL